METKSTMWKVRATHENGHYMERIADQRGIELMRECGYVVERICFARPDAWGREA